ncbi:MAG: TIGR00725 family protein [Nitrospinota bacterium]
MNRPWNIAVIGAGTADESTAGLAYEVGRLIAAEKWILVSGGLGGVMEAASKGARENGGTAVGILPGYSHSDGNRFLTISIPTGLGHARNAVIAAAANGLIAIGGEYGTLSEAALGLKMGKPVVVVKAIESWGNVKGIIKASTPEKAINIIKENLA